MKLCIWPLDSNLLDSFAVSTPRLDSKKLRRSAAALRATSTVALLASCTALGATAVKLGLVLCGEGLLGLGAAFLVSEGWSQIRRWRAQRQPAALGDTRA